MERIESDELKVKMADFYPIATYLSGLIPPDQN